MNAQEAITLCRFVKGACPQQAIDEYTPDAWVLILADYRFEDCQQAALQIVKESAFVAPAEIIQRVKAIRGKRIAEYGPIDPPPEVQRGEVEWRDWFIATRTAIADGTLKPKPREIDKGEARRVQDAIAGTFRSVDDAWNDPIQPDPEISNQETA